MIVAFEGTKTAEKFANILESGGVASCLLCHTAAEVKRMVSKRDISVVLCGYKLRETSAESLMNDLPDTVSMVVVASASQLEMLDNEDIFGVPAPVSRSDLIASVRMVMQMSRRIEKFARPRRNDQDKLLVDQAKAVLMEKNGMTEDQAHRYIQKHSMDSGAKMVQTARLILDEMNSAG